MHIVQRIFFSFIGIVFIAAGVLVYNQQNEKSKVCTEEVEAVITNIESERYYDSSDHEYDTRHIVYISYEYENNAYDEVLNYYESSMYTGKEITIYVNPNNPREIHLGAVESVFAFIISGMGLLVLLVGIFAGRFKKNDNVKKHKKYDNYNRYNNYDSDKFDYSSVKSNIEDRIKRL